MIDNSNIDDLIPAVEIASTLGINYIQIKPIVNYYSSNEQFSEESEMWKKLDTDFCKAKFLKQKPLR